MIFKEWIKIADFGFDINKKSLFSTHPDESPVETLKRNVFDKPIDFFNVEYLTEQLSKSQVGQKLSNIKFMNEVVWGDANTGSIKVNINPNFNVMIKKLNFDLEGRETWYTKKVFLIDRAGFGGQEKAVCVELLEELNELDKQENDVAKREIDKDEFRLLITKLATNMERVARSIFKLEEIRQVNDYNYIIKFGITGQGVEAPDHMRMEQLTTQLYHDPQRGIVRGIISSSQSPVGRARSWKISPSHSEFIFMPTQEKNEIIEAISTVIKYY